MRTVFRFVSTCVLLMLSNIDGSIAAQKKPFTVLDAVGLTRPSEFDAMELISCERESTQPSCHLSPEMSRGDGLGLVAVVYHGNPASGLTEYALMYFPMGDVLEFVNSPSRTRPPHQEVLAKFESSGAEPAIQQLKWLPNWGQLVFLGFRKEQGSIGQVYRIDMRTRRLEQLTYEHESIRSYSISDNGEVVVYSANVTPIRSGGYPSRFVVGAARDARSSVTMMMKHDPDKRPETVYFTRNLRTGSVVEFASDEPQAYNTPRRVYISHSGRWAVRRVAMRSLSQSWLLYRSVKALLEKPATQPEKLGWRSSEEAFGGLARQVQQFQIMDLHSGLMRPLVNAPIESVEMIPEFNDNAVVWSAGDSSVILSAVHLPLEQLSGEERSRAADMLVIAEVEVNSGRVRKIADLDVQRPRPQLSMEADGTLMVRVDMGQGFEVSRYRKTYDVWKEIGKQLETKRSGSNDRGAQDRSGVNPVRVIIHLADSIDRPPTLDVADLQTGRSRTLTSIEPSLAAYEMGRLEAVSWTDRLGSQAEGELLLPPDQGSRKRYPLVIQLHKDLPAYAMDSRLAAYPGRLWASREIALLQVSCIGQRPREIMLRYWANRDFGIWKSFAACIDGAISELDARGIVDPRRVGLIGFSAMGNYVYNAVTLLEHDLAAAMINDSVQSSLFAYVLFYGEPKSGIVEWDSSDYMVRDPYIGAAFYGPGIERWRERSPMFHLDRIRAPLLFECHGMIYPCLSWDTYAILKRQQLPVEMSLIPEGEHNLARVREQYTSRESTLDWFSFWLKGEEDPDPSKYKQYDRWHVLRRQQAAHLDELVKTGADPKTLPTLERWPDPRAKEPGSPTDLHARQTLGRIIAAPNGKTFVYEWLKPYNWTRDRLGPLDRKTVQRDQAWLYHVDLTPESYAPDTSQYLFIPLPRATYWLGSFSPDSNQLSFYELDYDTNTVTTGVWRKSDDRVLRFDIPADDAKVTQAPQWLSDDELIYPAKNGKPVRVTVSSGASALCPDCKYVPVVRDTITFANARPGQSHKPPVADPDLHLIARTPSGDVDIYRKDTPESLGLVFTRDWAPEPIVVFQNKRSQ